MTNAEIRKLKAAAQHLDPLVRVGKAGLTGTVMQSLEQALTARQLVKVRLEKERAERDALAAQIVTETGASLIMQVGKVAVFYRPLPVTRTE